MTRVALIATGIALCVTNCIGPAAAGTTEEAISISCGRGHADLAPLVEAAARRHLVDRVVIVALIAHESRCDTFAVGRHDDRGLGQLRGVARAGLTRRDAHDPAKNLNATAKWLAAMTTWCGSLPSGLGAYNTGKCGKGRGYARKVLATVRRIWTEMAKRREPLT
jgi:soluble lytic murein transglycosylase-like protein